MQNRILLIITIVLSIILGILSSTNHTTFFNTKVDKQIINVKDTTNNKIDSMEIEDYIVGVVAAEMPASFDIEALKAQAIASRTYAMYKIEHSKKDFDVVTDVSNQSYITVEQMQQKWASDFDKYYTKVKMAVDMTKGQIMLYNDEIIESYYFAMSNGYTENASLVFMEDREYLQSVESTYDNENLKNFIVTKEFTQEDICSSLNIKCDVLEFSNIERSNTNRVISIKVNGTLFKGTDFRAKLNLRSTDFDIKKENNLIKITTKGYGHGVGMSQYGANGMAQNGYKYDEILKYYYKNIKISSI